MDSVKNFDLCGYCKKPVDGYDALVEHLFKEHKESYFVLCPGCETWYIRRFAECCDNGTGYPFVSYYLACYLTKEQMESEPFRETDIRHIHSIDTVCKKCGQDNKTEFSHCLRRHTGGKACIICSKCRSHNPDCAVWVNVSPDGKIVPDKEERSFIISDKERLLKIDSLFTESDVPPKEYHEFLSKYLILKQDGKMIKPSNY